MIQVSNTSAAELIEAVSQAEDLASKPSLNRQEERKYSLLLAKISLLTSGFSSKEIAHVEAERLAKIAGVANIRSMAVDSAVEREWRDFLSGRGRMVPQPIRFEVRAQDLQALREKRAAQEAGQQSITYTAGAAGGYFVPQGFFDRELAAMRQYDEIFDDANCQIVESQNGDLCVIPQLDDTTASAIQISENTKGADNPGQIVVASGTQLAAYTFRSAFVFVTMELLQDSGIPIGALLERAFAIRMARGVGQSLISGSGVGAPQGLVTAASQQSSVVVAQGSVLNSGGSPTGANSIGEADIANLMHALNRAYRRNAVWYMSDDTFTQQLLPLLDKSGRPLVNLADGLYTLMGKPIATCPSMSDVAPSAYTIILADPNYFLQRRIAAGSYIRLYSEAPGTIENGVRAFASWYRTDSRLAVPSATYPPCSILQMHS